MIKVQYSYFCDYCETEFKEKEEYSIMPYMMLEFKGIQPLLQFAQERIGSYQVCPKCFHKALEPLRKERLEFNAKCRGD